MFKVYTQGKQVKEEEHQELLQKMKQFEQQRAKVYLKNPTVEQVLDNLKDCNEVMILLKDDTTLRVCKDYRLYVNGIPCESIKPTSDTTGQLFKVDYTTRVKVFDKVLQDFIYKDIPVYTNIAISNNYTGQQQFIKLLQKYLN